MNTIVRSVTGYKLKCLMLLVFVGGCVQPSGAHHVSIVRAHGGLRTCVVSSVAASALAVAWQLMAALLLAAAWQLAVAWVDFVGSGISMLYWGRAPPFVYHYVGGGMFTKWFPLGGPFEWQGALMERVPFISTCVELVSVCLTFCCVTQVSFRLLSVARVVEREATVAADVWSVRLMPA